MTKECKRESRSRYEVPALLTMEMMPQSPVLSASIDPGTGEVWYSPGDSDWDNEWED